ncbi:MAG: hypothetical protein COW00_07895 [Bdellovibrio sp. CG12_big_fil_rev_8_21_14_0_65_39_13]|nr:MAG: hypothetical protein COW78_03605 [Bdellovibrio sp. CG22_combo_CG10-13_8_21_14_all_39_27]PIQ60037.1 MAG: hypothetical protein COW00_07895 [Bdellovibrio sp. CG12_big_fil_rev_8_21_14_0_65_39_13]PIR35214.1 MAG: hypothetical protein COV37_09915 [Bdellovibrio sp. CG11_big_fil_rev_8_21_14_0_20_39_38]
MQIQKETIQEFLKLYDKPTLNQIFKMTGIQKTRFFRISNGMEMRLAEYVILKNLIDQKKVKHGKLRNLVELCLHEMNPLELEKIEQHLEKSLRSSLLKNERVTSEVLSA